MSVTAQQKPVQEPQPIGQVAEHVVAAFEPIVEDMLCVRGSVSDLQAAIERFAGTGQDIESGHEEQLHSALVTLLEELQNAQNAFKDQEVAERQKQLPLFCDALRRSSRELRSLAYSTKIVAAPAGNEDYDWNGLAEEMQLLGQRLDAAAETVGETASVIQDRQSAVAESLAMAIALLQNTMSSLTEIARVDDTSDAEVDMRSTDSLELVRDFNQSVSQKMPEIIACMQHSDTFSQRAAHVDDAIGLSLDTQSDDCISVVAGLAHVQCEDMTSALEEVFDTSTGAMRFISAEAEKTRTELNTHMKAETRREQYEAKSDALASLIDQLSEMQGVVDDALVQFEKMDESLAAVKPLVDQSEDGKPLFDHLTEARQTLRNSAFNATISAQRLEKNSESMKTVSIEIRLASDRCAERIDSLMGILNQLFSNEVDISTEAISQTFRSTMQQVAATQGAVDGLASAAQEIIAAAEACNSAIVELSTAAKKAEQQIASARWTVDQTRQFGEELGAQRSRGVTVIDDTTRKLLSVISDTYSLERERFVQDAYLEPLSN